MKEEYQSNYFLPKQEQKVSEDLRRIDKEEFPQRNLCQDGDKSNWKEVNLVRFHQDCFDKAINSRVLSYF